MPRRSQPDVFSLAFLRGELRLKNRHSSVLHFHRTAHKQEPAPGCTERSLVCKATTEPRVAVSFSRLICVASVWQVLHPMPENTWPRETEDTVVKYCQEILFCICRYRNLKKKRICLKTRRGFAQVSVEETCHLLSASVVLQPTLSTRRFTSCFARLHKTTFQYSALSAVSSTPQVWLPSPPPI